MVWGANSMQQAIINSLQSNPAFTDQIFTDSNLSVLIDVFAYMYDVLAYQMNHGASEAIFTDAQLYENMNRIVKMLGYNPAGFTTSVVTCQMGIKASASITPGIYTIPKFTTITTSLVDSNSNPVSFSFVNNYVFVAQSSTSISSDFTPIIYNGSWKLYDKTFVTQGIPFEAYALTDLVLWGTDRVYVADKYMYVYAVDQAGATTEYAACTNIYDYGAKDNVFELRLNENRQYTLEFGDGINGSLLPANSTLYVVYLESNGTAGEIGANAINSTYVPAVAIAGLDESFIKNNILKVSENPGFITFGSTAGASLANITFSNSSASTAVVDLEDVDTMRTNAPEWFRMGSRLITARDFKNYIEATYKAEVYTCSVQNNWDYMVEFQKWLKDLNKLNTDIRFYGYTFADSCDFNNVYVWLKSPGSLPVATSTKRIIENDCDQKKPLTSELVFLDPFITMFAPFVSTTSNYTAGTIPYPFEAWDPDYENKIVLTRDRNTMITVERIQQQALSVIQTFFAVTSCDLGMTMDFNALYNQLMAIEGVKTVQTSYLKAGSAASSTTYVNGLSFGVWTPHIALGTDFVPAAGNFKLKSFQFPQLYNAASFANSISVVSDSYNVNDVEF